MVLILVGTRWLMLLFQLVWNSSFHQKIEAYKNIIKPKDQEIVLPMGFDFFSFINDCILPLNMRNKVCILLFLILYFKSLKYTTKASKNIEKAKDKKKGQLYEKGYCWFLNCLCLASQFSWILMSLSIIARQCSNSTWLFVVCKMVLNKFKAMLIWFDNIGSISGCLVTGTVMRDKDWKNKLLCFILRVCYFCFKTCKKNSKTLK
jgi:hypothetical protein